MTPEIVIDLLRRHLDSDLLRHSLGAADTAADLAGRYGADRKQAYLAGLVHD
ncbi:MAG: HD domain-containing protein, partial [Bacillota bacterium]